MHSRCLTLVLAGGLILTSASAWAEYNPFLESRNSDPVDSAMNDFEMDQLRDDIKDYKFELDLLRDELGEVRNKLQGIDSSSAVVKPDPTTEPDNEPTEKTDAVSAPAHYESFMVMNGEYVLKNTGQSGPPYLVVDQKTYNDRLMKTSGNRSGAAQSNGQEQNDE